jgi:hypothetical protein
MKADLPIAESSCLILNGEPASLHLFITLYNNSLFHHFTQAVAFDSCCVVYKYGVVSNSLALPLDVRNLLLDLDEQAPVLAQPAMQIEQPDKPVSLLEPIESHARPSC